MNLDYSKIGLLYQRNVNLGNMPVSLILGTGGYYSYLNNAQETINNETVSLSSNYQKFDYGLIGHIGLRNEAGRFILEYGLKSEYGLVNIFAGNDKMNPLLDKTNLINTSAFVTFKIKIDKNTLLFQPK